MTNRLLRCYAPRKDRSYKTSLAKTNSSKLCNPTILDSSKFDERSATPPYHFLTFNREIASSLRSSQRQVIKALLTKTSSTKLYNFKPSSTKRKALPAAGRCEVLSFAPLPL